MKSEIPILFFTQLMGIAFGYTIKELGLNRNLISAEKMLKKYGYKK
jgi:heterodisulfide reductase subunit B